MFFWSIQEALLPTKFQNKNKYCILKEIYLNNKKMERLADYQCMLFDYWICIIMAWALTHLILDALAHPFKLPTK